MQQAQPARAATMSLPHEEAHRHPIEFRVDRPAHCQATAGKACRVWLQRYRVLWHVDRLQRSAKHQTRVPPRRYEGAEGDPPHPPEGHTRGKLGLPHHEHPTRDHHHHPVTTPLCRNLRQGGKLASRRRAKNRRGFEAGLDVVHERHDVVIEVRPSEVAQSQIRQRHEK